MDILHCDLNNFFASVEQAVNPELKAKYIAVSGDPNRRSGIILAKNTAAKQMGVQTGEAIWQAKRKCPQLVCVPPHYEYYVHFSQRVRAIYEMYTDRIEPFGMDECWLDVTHSKVFGTPFEIAEKIRERVKAETDLTVSVGVSFTKTFAKLGSDLKKPDATTVIDRNNYKQVVWTLPVQEMLFIGKNTAKALNAMGIVTLGDLANANTLALKKRFGIVGERMQKSALGQDDDEQVRPVNEERPAKSVGHGTTTLRDMCSYQDADVVMMFLCDMVATRLRRYGLQGNVVHLYIRHSDLSTEGKQCQVPTTFVADNIYHCAQYLLREIWKPQSHLPLRSLSVQVSGLMPVCAGVQLNIFDTDSEKTEMLQYSVDKIRNKFGYDAIKRASLLNNDLLSNKNFAEEDLLPFKR